ncbi:hypothetical protein [Bradyrhizobium diazoefficiens]|uniref:hypothetical protein n=1 Tax=Bradyrhizobium diazoefficiens TaxID=1355477 RepID=UPI0034959A81
MIPRIRLRLDEQSRDARMLSAHLGLDRDDSLLDIIGALVVCELDTQRRDDLGRRQLHRSTPLARSTPGDRRAMSRMDRDRSE